MSETTFDFGDGPVPAHQHTNPDGSTGGWVADTAFVSSTVYVGQAAQVFGDAWVSGGARVFGDVTPIRDRSLAAKVLSQIETHPETHDQEVWHSDCGTRHCAAGWIVTLAGEHGKALELRMGTRLAAAALVGEEPEDCPFGPDDDPLPWLRQIAEQSEEGGAMAPRTLTEWRDVYGLTAYPAPLWAWMPVRGMAMAAFDLVALAWRRA